MANTLAYYDTATITAVKSFIVQAPVDNVIKLITAVIYGFCNKLECLSRASLSRIFECLWARPGAYPRVEDLKSVSHG